MSEDVGEVEHVERHVAKNRETQRRRRDEPEASIEARLGSRRTSSSTNPSLPTPDCSRSSAEPPIPLPPPSARASDQLSASEITTSVFVLYPSPSSITTTAATSSPSPTTRSTKSSVHRLSPAHRLLKPSLWLFGGIRTNAKPDAALAVAAAASRSMPTLHAAAIKSRRSAGSGVFQKVVLNLGSLQNSHEGQISCLGLSADGSALCTGSWDTNLKMNPMSNLMTGDQAVSYCRTMINVVCPHYASSLKSAN